MLVLSRRVGEEIVIRTPEGREIVITVKAIQKETPHQLRSGITRLGFTCHQDIAVNRREVQTQIDMGTPRKGNQ